MFIHTVLGEDGASDFRTVLDKRHRGESRDGAPQLDLAIKAPGCNVAPIGAVREGGHVGAVSLLLEHVRLRLPLPHQQLPELRAPKRLRVRHMLTVQCKCSMATGA